MHHSTAGDQFQACVRIGTYLEGAQLVADTYEQQILIGTLDRATSMFAAITTQVQHGSTLPAAILTRPLFEDMAVMHWLMLHDAAPAFLTDRFHDQLDAIALLEADTYERFGWTPVPDVTDLQPRKQELRDEFGRWVTRDWWAVRPDGRKIDLPGVVNELSKARRFHPRFTGEQPVLRMNYELANKFAAQCLHHTGVGLPVRLSRENPNAVRSVPAPSPFRVLSTSYWTFAQLVFLVLDTQGLDFREFEDLYLRGLYRSFGTAPEMANRSPG